MFDEFAWIEGESNLDEKVYAAVTPSVAHAGGRIVVVSTPAGAVGKFWSLWTDPSLAASRVTVHWTDCPDLKVREEKLAYGARYWVEGRPDPVRDYEFRREFCNEFDPGIGSALPIDEASWREMTDPSVETWDD